MRKQSHVVLLLLVAFVGGVAPARVPNPAPPQVLYGDLYRRVQAEKLFADGKTFADAIAKRAPGPIMQDYEGLKSRPDFSLRNFVDANFIIPGAAQSDFRTLDSEEVRAHIERLWGALTRDPKPSPGPDSLLPLRARYVVPGGRFREMYYWDSYFTMVGLQAGGHHDLVASMVENFAGLIDDYGHIPNGNRSYYLGRSQPPFFAAMVELQAKHDGLPALVKRLPQLEAEHDFWMSGAATLKPGTAYRRVVRLADGSLLNRYWDDSGTPRDESYQEDIDTARASGRPPADVYHDLRAAAESGWDFGSRWFGDGKTLPTIRTTEILPIDLNSLLYKLELTIARGCEAAHQAKCRTDMLATAAARKRAVVQWMWSQERGAFVDYDWRNGKRMERITAAAAYPLFADLADARQAHATAAAIRKSLLQPHGLATTTEDTGQQWDAPNGWAPLQWLAIDGLRRHAEGALAREIATRWVAENTRVYCRTGKLVEKYDVRGAAGAGAGGEYPVQDGFGWTNGILVELLVIYPKLAAKKYEFTGAECAR